jgi:hypothetical protein
MLRTIGGRFFSGVALVLGLLLACVDASAAQVQVPATHPRLFYGNASRLAQAQAYLASHPLSPSGSSSTAMMERALRGMLTSNDADCDAAAAFLVGWQASAQGSGVRDALRQQGEDLLLIYDWCHHRLTAPQITTLVARWNGYLDDEFADGFANLGSEANNYWWGRTRNSLLWGIASFNDNARAQYFIDQGLDVRMDRDFARWYQDFGRGGVFAEGTDYGVTMLAYPLIAFASAADFGYDPWGRSPFFREAIYALAYGTTPGPTSTVGGSTGIPLVFPFDDDEHFFDGGVIGAREYLGDYAAYFGQRDSSANARHMRAWLAATNAGRRWMFDAIRSTAAADQADLPLDYYAPGAGVVDLRSSNASDAMQVHLQLNTPGGIEHRHLDAGSFQVWRRGRWLSRESVGYSDTIAGLAGVGDVLSEDPVAHNTLMFEGRTTGMWIGSGPRVIPPGAPREDNPDGLPQVVRLQHAADFAFVAADYSAAYRNHDGPRVDWPYADRAVREFLFVRPLQALVILDRMRASSDSLLPFYSSPDWLLTGPHVGAAQVRRTFAMHFETAPSVAGARVTAVNGGQTTDLITLVPAGPTYRVVNEDRPGDEQVGQYRLELDSTGSAESYFLQVVHGRDNGTTPLAATVVEHAGDWVLTLNGQGGQTATITLLKGMSSAGGSIALNGGAATPLRADVQDITVTSDGPAWGGGPAPLPELAIDDPVIAEGDAGTKVLNFTVSLSKPAETPVSFSIATANGTAVAGVDFVARTLTGQSIAAGQSQKTFAVTINGDTTVEPTETLSVNLQDIVGATPVDTSGTGYLINDDGPLLTINDIAIGEGNAGTKVMTFTVSLSQVAPGPVSYNIASAGGDATAGVDYTALNLAGQVIPQGQLAKTHGVTIHGDTTVEPTEVVLVNVRQPVGASVWDGQGTGYILNDDGPTLSIPDASVGEGNSGSKMMNVTVLLSQVSANPVTFSIATANVSATSGSDYTGFNLTNQTIPAGQTSKVFQVPVAGDTTVEPNETFLVTLGANPVGATLYDRQAIATIYNDDGPTLSINDVSVSEGNSGTKVATFTVTLSQAAAAPVTYNIATSNLTATAGSDFVARSLGGESIPAGQLSKAFTVTLNGDTSVEANETFRVTLSNISNNATLFKFTGTGTITNDD